MSVHLSPEITVPAAVAMAVGLGVYWRRLGRPIVPMPRRRVRRTSLILQWLSLPALVRGLSFVDPVVSGKEYVVTWTTVFALLVLVLLTAGVDMLVTFHLERRAAERVGRAALARHLGRQGRLHETATGQAGDASSGAVDRGGRASGSAAGGSEAPS